MQSLREVPLKELTWREPMLEGFLCKTLQKDVGFHFYTTCEIIGYSWKAYKLAQIWFKVQISVGQFLDFGRIIGFNSRLL
jgi:hypothetical protein